MPAIERQQPRSRDRAFLIREQRSELGFQSE
jgi:hypothetical protein